MAFAGFGKKRDDNPIDAVLAMQQQGYSNDQIVQNLQSQGFNQDQIRAALSQAEIKQGVAAQPQQQPMPQQPPEQQPPEGMPPPMPAEGVISGDVERIEEIAEAIVEEKWKELIKSVDKINEWKSQTEQKLSTIEDELSNLREDFDKLHTAILGKIGEYDQNIVNLSAEIKAMEKVFQKILPTFTENVNELSRITRALKNTKLK